MKALSDPVLHGRRLRTALRDARVATGLSQAEAARLVDWSISKMRRIETGRSYLSTPDIRALLDLYGIYDEGQRQELTTLARKSRWRPWNEFQDVLSHHFLEYLRYEASAARVRTFEPLVVPGLLQTEDYMQAVIRATSGRDFSETEIKRRIQARAQRQVILADGDAPEFHFIIDEAAIRRNVGRGTRLMRDQLEQIQNFSDRSNVVIQILPLTAGEHPGLAGPFVCLEFPTAADGDLVFLERGKNDLLTNDTPDETRRYLKFFRTLEKLALPGHATRSFLDVVSDGSPAGSIIVRGEAGDDR